MLDIIACLYPQHKIFFSSLKDVVSIFAARLELASFWPAIRKSAGLVYQAVLNLYFAAGIKFYLPVSDEDCLQDDKFCHHVHA